MTNDSPARVAIVFPGTLQDRRAACPVKSRLLPVADALAALGVRVEPAIYHDDFADEVRAQLMQMDGVLVWVNPIEDGLDRSRLDVVLREVAAAGVFVSAHPEVILKIGTKEVLYRTRQMGWGSSDTGLHRTAEELQGVLSSQMMAGQTRVLKINRGHSGNGVWKIEPADPATGDPGPRQGQPGAMIRVRQALRGSVDEYMPLQAFAGQFSDYFEGGGQIINQRFQPRLPEGMVRCYLVRDKVAGYGLQAINALCPAPAGTPREAVPTITARLYHPPTLPPFQALKRQLETEWLPQLQRLLDIETASLPVIWDCDFLLGAKDPSGQDTYVLCEINVSCVSPFPDSAIEEIARATLQSIVGRRGAGHP